MFQKASFGPLQRSGGVALSNFDLTYLSIHATFKDIIQAKCNRGIKATETPGILSKDPQKGLEVGVNYIDLLLFLAPFKG